MPQFNFEFKPAGESLGITARELGRQIRNAFYGAEALRQPRDRDELRVMVRLPEADRRTLAGLEDLLVRAPGGGEIPLGEAATITAATAPVRIDRVDGGRVLNVTANVIAGENTGNKVLAAFAEDGLPQILARYPGLRYRFEGEQREQREAMRELAWGLVAALFAIYAIMAALLRSYKDALVVLLTIPWSLAGAVIGHVLLGFGLSVFSVFGMIALCGMVVNGGFVLAVTRNRLVQAGHTVEEANTLAALRRFRPIILTALTTFLGLLPMIFETSIQALFLVPMAISLGIGTLVSSAGHPPPHPRHLRPRRRGAAAGPGTPRGRLPVTRVEPPCASSPQQGTEHVCGVRWPNPARVPTPLWMGTVDRLLAGCGPGEAVDVTREDCSRGL